MLGRTHVVAGSAAWLAVAPIAARELHRHVTLPQLAVGILVAGGAALTPDLDNHGMDCAAHTFSVVTELLDKAVSTIAKRHRGPTHSILATAAVTAGIWEAGRYRWGLVITVFVLSGMALHVAGPRRTRRLVGQVAAAGVIAYAVWYRIPDGVWLPASVAIGYASHVAIDMGNKQPVSWLWPLRLWPRGVHVTLVPLESMREYVGAALCSAFIVWTVWEQFSPALRTLKV